MHISVWDINATSRFTKWYLGLRESEAEDVTVAIELLGLYGPSFLSPIRWGSRVPDTHVPKADDLYDEYLEETGQA